MSTNRHIHWHEGLFLQPHHLQAQQRHLAHAVAAERRLAWAFPYGVIDLRLSAGSVENLLVRFDRLRAVLPSGVVVDVPDAADLPPLDIKQAVATAGPNALTVYLGVPLYCPNRANVVDAGRAEAAHWKVNRPFRLAEVELRDENTGENPQPTLVRRTNARLLLDGDDTTDLEVLPLLRVVRAAGPAVGLPASDAAFIPPAMVLGGSAALQELVRGLADAVEASRRELARQMVRGGFALDAMRGGQIGQAMRLAALGRAAVRLAPLTDTPSVTPFDAYQELKLCLAELAALEPAWNPLADVAAYDHNDLTHTFAELARHLRAWLRDSVAARYVQMSFVKESDGLQVAPPLADEHLRQARELFLGVHSNQDARAVVELVEDADRFRLIARSLTAQRIFGLRLAEQRHPPADLPSQDGLTYFRIVRADSARLWERVVAERVLAAQWVDMEQSDFVLTLYMTTADDRSDIDPRFA